MKKMIMAIAVVAAVAVANAATFNWASSAAAFSVVSDDVLDNGSYGVSSAAADRMNTAGTWTYVLSIMSGDTVVGTASGTMAFNKLNGRINTTNIEVASAAAGTAYDYVLTITGTDTGLTGRGKVTVGDTTYDYSAATLTTQLSGSITTANNGATGLATAVPSSWEVSGITKTQVVIPDEPGGGDVPEPTSGLLLLMGLAGLALRRKQA